MAHLGIREFLVLGNCIGGPFIMKLLQRAPDRVVAAVLSQPSGHRPEDPDIFWNNNTTNWGPALCARRPDITMAMIERFLHNMYRSPADFVFTVTRDFVRSCQTPILALPDDIPPHPFAISMEIVSLAPKAEASIYPMIAVIFEVEPRPGQPRKERWRLMRSFWGSRGRVLHVRLH